MAPTIKKNTVSLGDNEHKGEDVSPGSAIGLATPQLLQTPPGSLPPRVGAWIKCLVRTAGLGARRGWFVHSGFLRTGPGSTALGIPLVREQDCATESG